MKTRNILVRFAVVLLVAGLLVSCTVPDTPAPTEPAEATSEESSSEEVSPTEDTGEAAGETEAQPTEEETKGGQLVFAMPSEPDSLDPACTNSTFADNQYKALYDSLIFWGPDKEYYPNLATDWEISDDAKTITFHLREDVTFHDGTPFNAEAVKINLDRLGVVECSVGKVAAGLLGEFYESTEVLDDYTVQINFSEPNPAFLDSASFLYYSSPTAMEKWGEDYGRHPVGTGPFMFEEWEANDHLTVVPNPDYNWAPPFVKHQGPPYLDSIKFRLIPEASTALASLELNEVQVVRAIEPTDVEFVKENPELELNPVVPPGIPIGWNINVTLAPTDDLRVRQAISYGVDRELMINTLFADTLTPAYSPLSPTTWSYWPGSEEYYLYNQDKANELLDEAGWVDNDGDGIREKDGEDLVVTILDLETPERVPAWEFFQAQLREIGVDLSIEFAEAGVVVEECHAGRRNICAIHWGLRDPANMANLFASKNIGTGFNWSHWDSEEADELLEAGATEADLEERKQIYQDLQKLILEENVFFSVFATPGLWANRTSVQDLVYLPSGRHVYFYDTYLSE